MRTNRHLTPALALLCCACVAIRPVAPQHLRYADRIVVSSQRPMLLRESPQPNQSQPLACPVRAIEGRVAAVRGDSVWIDQISSRTLAEDAPGDCVSVFAGVIHFAAAEAATVRREEFDSARTAGMLAVALIVVVAAVFAAALQSITDAIPAAN